MNWRWIWVASCAMALLAGCCVTAGMYGPALTTAILAVTSGVWASALGTEGKR